MQINKGDSCLFFDSRSMSFSSTQAPLESAYVVPLTGPFQLRCYHTWIPCSRSTETESPRSCGGQCPDRCSGHGCASLLNRSAILFLQEEWQSPVSHLDQCLNNHDFFKCLCILRKINALTGKETNKQQPILFEKQEL